MIPEHFANIWDQYIARVNKFDLAENARFRQIHLDHATHLVPEEKCFVTPEAIRACCFVGEPEEIIERIKEKEKAGINEINIMPMSDEAGKVYRDFAEFVLPAFR